MDDAYLIAKKAQKGDNTAFSELIKMNQEKLYRIAFTYLKNEQDALDAVSHTIYKAYMNIKKLNNPKYFNTWITRILINCCADMFKKNSNVLYIEDYSYFNEDYMEDSEFNITDNIDLYNAIDTLDVKFKNIIILKYFEDMSINEISHVLKIPKAQLKSICEGDYKN